MKRTVFEAEHEQLRDSFRGFLDRHVKPCYGLWESAGIVDRQVWEAAGSLGFLAFSFPERYGGANAADVRYNAIVGEEIGRSGYHGLGFTLQNDVVAPYLLDLATDWQRDRWFPGFCAGTLIGAIAITEPDAGSDMQGIKTSAKRQADGSWILNGSKSFVSNGINADIILVLARTSPGASALGMSIFVVERETPGVERVLLRTKMGQSAQDTADIHFNEVTVPAQSLLGAEGRGLLYVLQRIPAERLSIAIGAAAGMRRCIELTTDYVRGRKAFGSSIGSLQNTRFVIAELSTRHAAVQALVDKTIECQQRGELSSEAAAMAKWFSTEEHVAILGKCLQLHGGYGYMRDFEIVNRYLDARVQTVYGGTTEIMKEIIANSLDLSGPLERPAK